VTTASSNDNRHSPSRFSRDAWSKVSVSAQGTVLAAGDPGWARLAATVTNQSSEDLRPDQGMGVAFSFRLLQQSGQEITFESVRTPLQAVVPAGSSHTQEIQVIIPSEHLQETAAIRVGLLQLREFWVESINPQHPQLVSVEKGPELNPSRRIIAEASKLWPKGQNNALKWPYSAMMVSQEHRLFYIPIAKCACTSLKSMMIELARIDHYEQAIKLGVHLVTDRFNTGIQLKDQPMDVAREILASDQYLKFSVVREPFERLVSAYLEKFVYNREHPRNLLHTRQITAEVQGSDEIDLQKGISFDDFIGFILRQDSWDLDPHWRPQYLYMRGVPHLDRIFRIEDLGNIESYLLEKRNLRVKLAHRNRISKSSELLAAASSCTAEQLDEAGAISPDSFLSSPHAQAIREYFREDFDLYEAATGPASADTP